MILTVAELFNKLCESEYFAGVLTGFKGPIRLEMPKVPAQAQSPDGADRIRAAEFLETWAENLRLTVIDAPAQIKRDQALLDLRLLCNALHYSGTVQGWIITDLQARLENLGVAQIIERNTDHA